MFKSRQACLVWGLVGGLVIGLNVVGIWPQIPVQATATHGIDRFAIATGPISNEVEAVIILDNVTGDLKAAVINLQTGKFLTVYSYNVLNDLKGDGGETSDKGVHFLMVTGLADLRRGGMSQLGQTVVYVAEFSSGKMAAYGLPWTTGRENMVTAVQSTFQPLDIMKFRSVKIRK